VPADALGFQELFHGLGALFTEGQIVLLGTAIIGIPLQTDLNMGMSDHELRILGGNLLGLRIHRATIEFKMHPQMLRQGGQFSGGQATVAPADGTVGIEVLAIDAFTGIAGRGCGVGGSHRSGVSRSPAPHIVRTSRQRQYPGHSNNHLQKIRTHTINLRKNLRNCSL
jgi:hypothetical protein